MQTRFMGWIAAAAILATAEAVEPVGFVAPQSFAVSGRLLDLTLADVDGDGDLDVVTANRLGPNYVAWFENNGAGLLAPEARVPGSADSAASLVLAGDVDGDGDTDLLTGGIAASRLRLLRNDGSGDFTAETVEAIQQEGKSGVLSDLDADGDLDFAHFSIYGGVWVYAGDGTGSFAASGPWLLVSGVGPGLAAADLDGRSGRELLVPVAATNDVRVLAAASGLAYAETQSVALAGTPSFLAAGDLDGDGDADAAVLVLPAGAAGRIQLLWNDGTGVLSAGGLLALPGTGTDVVIADVNADAVADVVALDNGGGVTVVLGDGFGGFLPPQTHATGLPASPLHAAAADLGGDARAEVVVGSYTNSSSPTALVLLRHSDLPGPRDVVAEPAVLRTAGPSEVRLRGADLQNLSVVDAGPDLPVGLTQWASASEIDVRLDVPERLGSRTVVLSVTHPDGKRAYAGLDLQSVEVTLAGGRIVERARVHRDHARFTGTARYTNLASREAFTFANDALTFRFGDPAAPETVAIPANDVGWDVRAGRRHTWRSPRGAAPRVRLRLDTSTGDFDLRVTRADFASPVVDDVTVAVEAVTFGTMENRGSATTGPWTRDGRGRLRY